MGLSFWADLALGFRRSARALKSTRVMVTLALLVAMKIALTKLAGIQLGEWMRISFGYLPIAVAGMLFGPVAAMACAGVADVIGALLFPTGAFFPGYTLSAVLVGLIHGVLLGGPQVRMWHIVLAVLLMNLGVHLCLNTLWLSVLMGKAWVAYIPPRILKNVVQSAADVLLLWMTVRMVRRLPASLRMRAGE